MNKGKLLMASDRPRFGVVSPLGDKTGQNGHPLAPALIPLMGKRSVRFGTRISGETRLLRLSEKCSWSDIRCVKVVHLLNFLLLKFRHGIERQGKNSRDCKGRTRGKGMRCSDYWKRCLRDMHTGSGAARPWKQKKSDSFCHCDCNEFSAPFP